jgi:hypothetical protein
MCNPNYNVQFRNSPEHHAHFRAVVDHDVEFHIAILAWHDQRNWQNSLRTPLRLARLSPRFKRNWTKKANRNRKKINEKRRALKKESQIYATKTPRIGYGNMNNRHEVKNNIPIDVINISQEAVLLR